MATIRVLAHHYEYIDIPTYLIKASSIERISEARVSFLAAVSHIEANRENYELFSVSAKEFRDFILRVYDEEDRDKAFRFLLMVAL